MHTHPRLRLSPLHFPIFCAGAAFICLAFGVMTAHAQDLTWNGSVTAGDNNWFIQGNWEGPSRLLLRLPANGPANRERQRRPARRSSANIGAVDTDFRNAVAQQLIIGGNLRHTTPGAITPFGSGQVVVNGAIDGAPTLGYARVGQATAQAFTGAAAVALALAPVSLEVVQGSLLVENGGTLTTTGSGVGRIPGATGESLVTITGFFDGEGPISLRPGLRTAR